MIPQRLGPDEAEAAARVMRAALDAALPWLAGRYTPAQDTAFIRDVVLAEARLWGVAIGGQLLGIMAHRDGWIDQLHVLPGAQRQGIGTSMLRVAFGEQAVLCLWTFQRNTGARAFYERHGFVPVAWTDGSRNEEGEPDMLYRRS